MNDNKKKEWQEYLLAMEHYLVDLRHWVQANATGVQAFDAGGENPQPPLPPQPPH